MPGAGHDLQLGVRDSSGEDATVDGRDDGVGAACENERRGPEAVQPGKAGPPRGRRELPDVSPHGWRPGAPGGDLIAQELAVLARSRAVERMFAVRRRKVGE